MLRERLLSALLAVDGLLAVSFGLASWLAPQATFGTIVAIADAPPDSLVLAALASVSSFYVVTGLLCLVGAVTPPPHKHLLVAVMATRHAWIGIKGLGELGREWLVGDPWPDLIIHAAFVALYAALLCVIRLRPAARREPA